MSYASLMIYVEQETQHIKLAADLAGRCKARLIGVAAHPPMPVVTGEQAPIDSVLFAQEEASARALLDKAGERFRAIAGVGSTAVEWRSAPDFPDNFVVRESRSADLVIVGRAPTRLRRSLDVEGFLFRAGRPVLVVPSAVDSVGPRRAIVAWKDTREARRAVSDAVPILRLADSILLVEVCDWGAEDRALQRLKDVSRFLAQHRIAAVTERVLPDAAIAGDVLVRFAQEAQADLIVAGAYGHSRLGEWMFGGVTRDLLTKSQICCLFSH
jgi:nucleotide-binding universal stress UspA family protein